MEKNNGLPNDWEWAKIKDISERIHYGYTATAKNENTGIKFLRITDIQNNSVNWSNVPFCEIRSDDVKKFILHENDLVFARTGGTVGKSFLIRSYPPKAVFASYLIRIILSENMNPKFVRNFFDSFDYWNQIELNKTGLKTNVNAQILGKITIPIPPFNEQKRIVSKIEELFSIIENNLSILKNTINHLKQHKKSLIVSGLNGTLTQDFRETYKNLTSSKNLLKLIKTKHKTKNQYKLNFKKLNDLPEDWSWVTVSDIANVVSGNTPKGIDQYRKNEKIPFFKVADMNHPNNSLFMTFSELNLNDKEISDLKLKIHEEGTIIFPKRGGAISTNKKRIISKPSCFDLNIMGIKPIDIPSKFVYYWLLNIDLAGLSDGSNVPQINHGDVNPLPIPIPTKEEIDEIIKIFDNQFSINEQALDYSQKLIKMNQSLRNSIFYQAFSGKLVPQDPNDEPASELLNRINASN